MEIFNLHGDEWDAMEEHEGFASREAEVGSRIAAELIGGSLYEVPPGKKLWPYHLHHANEEWIVVLRGAPTLRTPEGERTLVEGDVACFLRGPSGVHQVINRTEEPVRVLMLSTLLNPEVLEYPDSGKTLGKDAMGNLIFCTRLGEPVEYWDREA